MEVVVGHFKAISWHLLRRNKKTYKKRNITHITALTCVLEPGMPGLLLPNQRFVALRNVLLTPFLLEI
jgi:hypothetical protein